MKLSDWSIPNWSVYWISKQTLLTSTLGVRNSHWEWKTIFHFSCLCTSVARPEENIYVESSSMLSLFVLALNDKMTFFTLSEFSLLADLSLWCWDRMQNKQWTFEEHIKLRWKVFLLKHRKLTLKSQIMKSNTTKTLKLLSFASWNV